VICQCTGCDPLLRAGIIVCPSCGRVSHPTDAAWVDADHVMATWPPPCEHTPGLAWVVAVDELVPQTRWCLAPTRSTGEPCRRRVVDDGRCHLHGGG
jgi:hypothetical protein